MDDFLLDSVLLDDTKIPSPAEVSLDVDSMAVAENSGKSFNYTFTRTGNTTDALTINFTLGGKATLDTDYTLTGAVINGTQGTVTIAANATTATVTIKPIADSEIESDEAVKLTLENGTDYIISDGDSRLLEAVRAKPSEGSSMDNNAVMAVIMNDDPMLDAVWAKKFDDKGNGYGYEFLAVDDAGNTYVTGYFEEEASVDGKVITRTGEYDTFVAKFDKDGKVEWAKEFGGSGESYSFPEDIAADSSGTYLTGTFDNKIVFGNETLSAQGLGYGFDEVYVAKLDTTGKAVWAKSFGGAENDIASGIEVDKDGNTYITGEFYETITFGNTTFNDDENGNVFIAKLDTKGEVLWAKEYGNDEQEDLAEDVVVDKEGNAYLFMTEGYESGTENISLVKLNKSDGSEVWKEAKTFGDENNYVVAEDIAIDNQDNIYIAGKFEDSLTFGSTKLEGGEDDGDAYIAKLDSKGDVLWAKDFSKDNNDDIEVEGIAVDDMGNTYVSGYYAGESMNVGDFMLYKESSVDEGWSLNAFLTKFDSDGKIKWAQNIGGTNYDAISDIAVKDGNIYLTGEFETKATFGKTSLTAQKAVNNPSIDNSSFLVKLKEEKPEISLTVDSTKVTEGENKQITYTFTRKGDSTSELTVDFSVTGSATFKDDYTLTGADEFKDSKGKVTFKAGEKTATVTLNIVDDSDVEEDETLGLELAMGSGYMLSATEVKTNITIAKDEKDIVMGSGNEDEDDDDDDTEFSLASKSKQTFKFKSKFKQGKSSIKFSFKSKSINQFKEIAVVTVDDDEGNIDGISPEAEGYLEAALNRAKSIFSLLGNTPQGFGDIDIEKVLEFSSETRFRFLSVKGGTLQGVKKGKIKKSQVTLSSTDLLQVSESEKNSFDLDFEGVKIKMKFDAKAKKAIGSGLQDTIEVLDLRSDELSGKQKVKCTVNREAAKDNIIGFYQVIDEEGGIDTDGDGTIDVFVGDENYTQTAVENRIASIDLSVENQSSAEFTGEFEAGAIIVPFLIVDGNPQAFEEVYFPFLGANSDGVDHVMMIGENVFGFEDLKGGGDRDYNDFTVKIEFTNVST
ncbi:MAG: DUF4114 domain-containing protein [Rivularia sp. (in: Bacteria)]|nr:DUF4114 domain-containing protein [Rivularia sp. MS3]